MAFSDKWMNPKSVQQTSALIPFADDIVSTSMRKCKLDMIFG